MMNVYSGDLVHTAPPLVPAVAMAHLERLLLRQGTSTRTDILYIAYLCVLGACCLAPCLYYMRISAWQRRHLREMRELEQVGMVAALARSTAVLQAGGQHSGQQSASATAERRARILQLLEPVRMVRTYVWVRGSFKKRNVVH